MKTTTAEPLAPHASPTANSPHARPYFVPDSKAPIRAELYGTESLEAHARQLAVSCQEKTAPRAGRPLLQRLEQNWRILTAVHRQVAQLAAQGEPLSPDAEWLLDNFYIIEDVLREVRHDLPRGYHEELPKLASGVLTGYPRIY
ncbi:MAG TPA: hypothetical protein VEL76_30245, partial [Gemmataceae bacterium]|nr:hypothetical protein [Gemmataceae bacterium]